jgi:hypothetical protein
VDPLVDAPVVMQPFRCRDVPRGRGHFRAVRPFSGMAMPMPVLGWGQMMLCVAVGRRCVMPMDGRLRRLRPRCGNQQERNGHCGRGEGGATKHGAIVPDER